MYVLQRRTVCSGGGGGALPEIVLLCGQVGSGKTFYADTVCADSGFFKLSCDDMMLALFESCIGPERHADMLARCKKYLADVALRLLRAGMDVVLDYGFWTRTERTETAAFFSSAGFKARVVYVRADTETRRRNLERRNAALKASGGRGYVIDAGAADFFDAQFEPPAPDEEITEAYSDSDALYKRLD